MPIVKMPDGQEVQFPDDMPKEQIQSFIAQKFPDAMPKSTARKALDFSESAAIGAVNLPVKLGQGLAQLLVSPFGIKAPSAELEKLASSPTGEMMGEIGAGFFLPGGQLGRGANLLGRLFGSAAEGAGYGTLLGAAEGDAKGGALTGAALGAGGQAVGESAGAGLRKLREMMLGRSTRTPEQMQALRQAAPEFKTDLFSLSGNPAGKEAYTQYLASVPGSGARKTMEKAVEQEQNIVNDMLGRMRGEHPPENIPEAIQEAVQSKYIQAETVKRNNYAAIDKAAEDLGVNVHNRDNLRKVANKYIAKHENALASANKSALSRETEALDDLSLSMAPDLEPGTGTPRTLEQSMHTWSSFGEAARRADNEGKKYVSGMYKDMQKALEKDVDSALEQAGGEELKGMWDTAKSHFKEEVLPFRHRGLRGVTSENEPYSPDKIHQLLMNPKHRDVLKKLDEQTKGQIAHQHFVTNAPLDEDGQIILSSARMHNQFKKLPTDVKKALFDEGDINVLNKLAAIRDISGDYRTQIKKPPTGMRNVQSTMLGALGASGVMNPVLTGKGLLLGNLLNRAVTSDALIDSYISGDPGKLLTSLNDLMMRGTRAATVAKTKKDK